MERGIRRISAARRVFGTDPRTSVLDTFCRTHDVENLFVVDASFFPSSAAVNPGLTIAAQALRVADHIKSVEAQPASSIRPAVVEAGLSRPDRSNVKALSFSHCGITVSDFNRCVKFYWEVFGCPLVGVADTPPERVKIVLRCRGRRRQGARSAGSACPVAPDLEIFPFRAAAAARAGDSREPRRR